MSVHPSIKVVTDRIAEEQRQRRSTCGTAVWQPRFHRKFGGFKPLNLHMVTSYDDMLSAHQPFGTDFEIINESASPMGAAAPAVGGASAENRELNGDVIAVVPLKAPESIGMPELLKLNPALAVLQEQDSMWRW